MPAALAHSPWFVRRNARRMLAHTFAGTTLRSLVGLDDEHAVFARYREQRRRERDAYRLPFADDSRPVAVPAAV